MEKVYRHKYTYRIRYFNSNSGFNDYYIKAYTERQASYLFFKFLGYNNEICAIYQEN